jgi:hypothetical protein
MRRERRFIPIVGRNDGGKDWAEGLGEWYSQFWNPQSNACFEPFEINVTLNKIINNGDVNYTSGLKR